MVDAHARLMHEKIAENAQLRAENEQLRAEKAQVEDQARLYFKQIDELRGQHNKDAPYCILCDEAENRKTVAREEALRANAAGKEPAKRTQTYVISSDDEDVLPAAARVKPVSDAMPDETESEDESADATAGGAAAGGAAPVKMPWPNSKLEETIKCVEEGDLTCRGRFCEPGEGPVPANIGGEHDADGKCQKMTCFLCLRPKRRRSTGGFAKDCASTGCDFYRRQITQAHKDAAARKKASADSGPSGRGRPSSSKPRYTGEPGKRLAYDSKTEKWHPKIKKLLKKLTEKLKINAFKVAELNEQTINALKNLPFEICQVCLSKVWKEEQGKQKIRNIDNFLVNNAKYLSNQWGLEKASSSSSSSESSSSESSD
jgi:hypothetical protein